MSCCKAGPGPRAAARARTTAPLLSWRAPGVGLGGVVGEKQMCQCASACGPAWFRSLAGPYASLNSDASRRPRPRSVHWAERAAGGRHARLCRKLARALAGVEGGRGALRGALGAVLAAFPEPHLEQRRRQQAQQWSCCVS